MSAKPQSHISESDRDSAEEWFIFRLKDRSFGGPFTLGAIAAALKSRQIDWTDLIFLGEGDRVWRRIFEIEQLWAELPPLPPAEELQRLQKRAGLRKVDSEERTEKGGPSWVELLGPASKKIPSVERLSKRYWYLLIDGVEVGPVELADIESAARLGSPPRNPFAWNVKLKRWTPFSQTVEFARFVGKAPPPLAVVEASLVIEFGKQSRRSPRKSFLAGAFLLKSGKKSRFIGVCGDVSPDGFQLVQNEPPIEWMKGDRIALEIRPSALVRMPSFKVYVVVKWVNSARGTVGFEFDTIDPYFKKLLKQFVENPV